MLVEGGHKAKCLPLQRRLPVCALTFCLFAVVVVVCVVVVGVGVSPHDPPLAATQLVSDAFVLFRPRYGMGGPLPQPVTRQAGTQARP